jgi:protein-tyrosine phosphatase
MSPFWVEIGSLLRLAIVSRPRGGDWLVSEADQMKRAGVDVLVSLLPVEEAGELGLSAEAEACHAAGIIFYSFPISDRDTPSSTVLFSEFVERLRQEAYVGRSIGVHCRASIGRSSLLLAALLCLEGFTPRDAFQRLSLARGLQVPDTLEQILWVERFAAARQAP